MRVFFPVLLLLLVLSPAPSAQDDPYRADVERWRAREEAGLRADNGWLTVVGLAWLRPGANLAGRGPAAAVPLPASGPERLGIFHLEGDRVRFEPLHPGVRVNGEQAREAAIRVDADGSADTISAGSLTLLVIKRGDRVGVRVRDRDSERRRTFQGRQWHPVRASWRVSARFVPYNPPKAIPIPNVLGQVNEQASAGYAVFTVAGREYRLDAIADRPTDPLFFIFRDLTSGETTYPAGRFLYTDPPKDGRVVLDFNKAENPPCAFTEFATCPLPPRQNSLRVAVEAGERYSH
ncbi:MAG TPA: DUF1684 domain-containing protein [Vicinamibacterales bacterium]|nr:DUF1684 domain-containing protein [Vicinamibacterales bacterium]